ncbi:MAG: TonB family protein [Muribaculaceae bacterium]|nr:TonB family protein [Muribaculaceae bacterium]
MTRARKIITMFALVLMSSLLTFAKDSAPTATQNKTTDNSNDFACNLFRSIYEQKQSDGSFIMSPISVGYMLGMLNDGAEGDTQRQITDVLGLDVSAQEINQHFKKIMDEASSVDSTVTIKIANSININSARGYRLIPKYKENMQKFYDAQIDAFPFTDDRNVDIINNWCNTHTDGMIPKILDSLDPYAAMYLLNAVFFKASWTDKFDPNNTRNRIFTKQDGTILEHKMMHVAIKAAYGSNNLCKMLRLPYGNGSYSMYVLLPHEGKTVGDIIQSLSAQQLEQQRTQEMTIHNVDIMMPRFTTESEIKLEQVLSSMGMPLAFHYLAAQFSKMIEDEELWVSIMMQKAKIEVNEKGTKATAVTIAKGVTKSLSGDNRPRHVEFHATRPFVYYIVDSSTGTIYFMGTYCGEEGVAISTEVTIDIDSIDSHDAVEILPEVTIESYGRRGKNRPLPELTINHRGYSVEQKPQFPGGDAALMKYLLSHIIYPPMAAENNIEGRVIVQFLVDKTTGKVGEVKVVRSADKYLDKEAIRVVKSLPKFTPGSHNGEPVDVWYVLPVTFMM